MTKKKKHHGPQSLKQNTSWRLGADSEHRTRDLRSLQWQLRREQK